MKLRDFVVVALVLDLLLGVFLFGLLGGFVGGVLLPADLKSKFIEGYFLVTTSAVSEDGTEECDAGVIEKNIFKKITDDQLQETEEIIQNFGENIDDGRGCFDESVRRYWAKSGQPMPK